MHYYNLFVHFYFVKTVHSYFIIFTVRSCRGKPSNNERQEVSRFHSSEETSVMEVERRDEQTKRSRPTLIVTVKPGLIELKVKTYTLIESSQV